MLHIPLSYFSLYERIRQNRACTCCLGHEARLDVYRLLVRAGEDGLIVGDIAAHTKLPLSTLAHHLRTLVLAGLVTQERRDGK
jgi:DNA-binding transcriptional ArsR family regulator